MRRLQEGGLVVDTGQRSSGRGRAGSYYTLAPECGAALVVSISPGSVVAESIDAFGAVLHRSVVSLDRYAAAGHVARALEEAGRAVRERTASALRAAVVSAADPVDRATGRLVHLPDAPFLVGDLDPVPVLEALVDGPMLIDNDVNWAARAEQAEGVVPGARDFVFLYLGEGLGCAVVSDGEVRRGSAGLAGEIAHVVVSGPSGQAMRFTDVFAQLGLRREGSAAIDVERLRLRLEDSAGDGAAGASATARALAVAVGDVVMAAIALTDPAAVVVGGPWGTHPSFVRALRAQTTRLPREANVVVTSVVDEPEFAGARRAALGLLRDTIVGSPRHTPG
jgi:predicted NBD/HSP70 family sugar kinase